MIDTIVAVIETDDISNVLMQDPNTKHVKEVLRQTETLELYYKNFKVLISISEKTNLKEVTLMGSINKYIHGNNLKKCTRKEIKEGIERISDELVIPFHRGTLFRIDIASNMVMEHPVEDYNKMLGTPTNGNYQPEIHNNYETIDFVAHNRELGFYNKIAEIRNKASKIYKELPYTIKESNILRYEFRMRKGLNKQVKKDIVKVNDLLNLRFYKKLLRMWKKEYKLVTKKPTIISPKIHLPKELKDYLALQGINHIGINETMSLIDRITKDGNLNPNYKRRMRIYVDELLNNSNYIETGDLIKELDTKVKRSVEFYL